MSRCGRRRYLRYLLTNQEDLFQLFSMLAEGRIVPAVAAVVPLTDVRRAHQRVEAGDVPGKLVMRVTDR